MFLCSSTQIYMKMLFFYSFQIFKQGSAYLKESLT